MHSSLSVINTDNRKGKLFLFEEQTKTPTCPESNNKDPTSTGLWNMISSTDTIKGLEPLREKKKFHLKNN